MESETERQRSGVGEEQRRLWKEMWTEKSGKRGRRGYIEEMYDQNANPRYQLPLLDLTLPPPLPRSDPSRPSLVPSSTSTLTPTTSPLS